MALKRPRQHTAMEKVLGRFVALASQIPEVQLVLYEEASTGGRHMLTVIDAPQEDAGVIRLVYDALFAAMPAAEEPVAEFHLENLRRYPGRTVDYYAAADFYRILFDRRKAA